MPIADVELPDGRVAEITGTRQQILDAAEELAQQSRASSDGGVPRVTRDTTLAEDVEQIVDATQESGFAPVAGEFFLRNLVDNIFAIPRATGEALALGGAGLEAAAGALSGSRQGFGERFDEALSQQREQFPASALRAIPAPTSGDVIAGGQSLLGDESFSEAQQGQQQRVERLRREQPFGAGVGEVGADVATIATGRIPRARAVARKQGRRRAQAIEEARRAEPRLPKDVEDELDGIVSSRIGPFFKRRGRETARGLGRVAEAGTEGAAIALLNDEDPLSAALFTGGAQGLGSVALSLSTHPVSGLLPFVGTAFVASQMFKTVGPGEKNFFESQDFAIEKGVVALGAGVAAASIGAGRFRGPAFQRNPALLDSIPTAFRGTFNSLIQEDTESGSDQAQLERKLPKFVDTITGVEGDVVKARINELVEARNQGNELPLRVLETMGTNSMYFSESEREQLGRAIQSKREGAFLETVDRLMRDRSFRDKLEALQ